mmetsp:Transcript_27993/g.24697  ORF Transcript_27993/g.24697 Transcript_27993/m.24697 type:complete len:96 (+) Transcript_27993:621-908(+)
MAILKDTKTKGHNNPPTTSIPNNNMEHNNNSLSNHKMAIIITYSNSNNSISSNNGEVTLNKVMPVTPRRSESVKLIVYNSIINDCCTTKNHSQLF